MYGGQSSKGFLVDHRWIIIADIYTDGGFILIYPALNVPEVGKNAFHIATELVDKLVTVR